jgi:hypothetical protein
VPTMATFECSLSLSELCNTGGMVNLELQPCSKRTGFEADMTASAPEQISLRIKQACPLLSSHGHSATGLFLKWVDSTTL